jgi:hypothetical protein
MQNASEEGSEGPAASEKTWHLEPLKLAGMDDIVSWIEENEGTNYSIWMPRVLEALDLAKMTDLQFVMATGNRPPLECCELMHALGEGIGAKRVIAAMASRYSVDGIPKAIVAMRRYPVEWIREASSSFVDFVADGSMPGTWAASKQRRDIRAIHDALGRANLNDDASRLISQVAKSRAGAGLVNLALSFPRDAPWDDGNILLSHLCDAGGTYRIVSTIKVIRDADRLSDKTKTEMLEMITGSIPDKAQASVRKALEQAGIIGLLHTPGDEPPF